MSICDEGWRENVSLCCPCLREYDRSDDGLPPMFACQLLGRLVKDERTCPHSAALRAVVENPEMVLVAVAPEVETLVGYDKDDKSCWLESLGCEEVER